MLKETFNQLRVNITTHRDQWLKLSLIGGGVVIVLLGAFKLSHRSSNYVDAKPKKIDFTGVVDSQFNRDDTESAMTTQQLELDALKKELSQMTAGIKNLARQNEEQKQSFADALAKAMIEMKTQAETPSQDALPQLAQNNVGEPRIQNDAVNSFYLKKPTRINTVSYQPRSHRHKHFYKNPNNYVPSGTFAKAVVLGGADADASVDGQNKNNGVMLFKIIDRGVLPNGQRSYLQGCFVTASAYGDISSERAYVKLDKLSCVKKGRPIVDKQITGWAFFGGKVGIKGIPLMRDNKIVAWAGISGALSGVAEAAQYAQSVQNFGAYGGATSVVPSNNIGPFAAYGGASKAAQQLSEYYIKRAEQYHPVIQVGAGNIVNIVFKDGFYFDDEEDNNNSNRYRADSGDAPRVAQTSDPIIPEDVLAQIDNQRGLAPKGGQ